MFPRLLSNTVKNIIIDSNPITVTLSGFSPLNTRSYRPLPNSHLYLNFFRYYIAIEVQIGNKDVLSGVSLICHTVMSYFHLKKTSVR